MWDFYRGVILNCSVIALAGLKLSFGVPLFVFPKVLASILEFVLDMYEREELQRINDELRERKRLLEERLVELNQKLQKLEALKAKLETERRQLEEECSVMENRVEVLEEALQLALQEQNSHRDVFLPNILDDTASELDESMSEACKLRGDF